MPLIVGAIVVILAVAGYFIFQAGNTQEFAAPKTEKVIPKFIFDTLPAAEQQAMLKDGYKVTDGAASGPAPGSIPGMPPTGAPGSPTGPGGAGSSPQ